MYKNNYDFLEFKFCDYLNDINTFILLLLFIEIIFIHNKYYKKIPLKFLHESFPRFFLNILIIYYFI